MYVYGTQGNISVARATVTNNSLYILRTEEGGDWISDEGGKEIFKHLAEHYNVNLPEHWDARRITPETVEAGMILKRLDTGTPFSIKVLAVRATDEDGDRGVTITQEQGGMEDISGDGYIFSHGDYVLIDTFDPAPKIELPTKMGTKFSTELASASGARWYDLMVMYDGDYIVLEQHNSSTSVGLVLPKDHMESAMSSSLRIKEILSV